MRHARLALATFLSALGCLLAWGCGSAESFPGGVRIPASTGEGASWSPDGRWLAIPNRNGILLRRADGQMRRQVAAPPLRSGFGSAPARISWSRDGSELRFITTSAPAKPSGAWMTVVGVDGGSRRQVALGTTMYSATWAAADWPLVFSTGPSAIDLEKGPVGPKPALWIVDGLDSPPRPFLDFKGEEDLPLFSPDGRAILFTFSPNERRPSSLWRARADGSQPRRLVGGLNGCGPSWSPDGRRVAINATTLGGNGRRHLYLLPASGGKLRQLTNDEVLAGEPPAWTPDGRWITYSTYDGEIKRVRPTGGRSKAIADFPDQEVRNLLWSPDGRHLAFSATPIIHSD